MWAKCLIALLHTYTPIRCNTRPPAAQAIRTDKKEDYKYPSVDPPDAQDIEAMDAELEKAEPPIYNEHGVQAASKKAKKRVAKPAAQNGKRRKKGEQTMEGQDDGDDDDAEPAEVEGEKTGEKPPAKAAPPAAEAVQKQAPAKPAPNAADDQMPLPSLAEVQARGAFVPPDHVTTNNIYSNAYRTSMKKTNDKEEAKKLARHATAIFKEYGVAVPDLCGTFRATKKKPAKDKENEKPDEPEQKHEAEDGKRRKKAKTGAP